MRAPQLTQRLTLEAAVRESDAAGGYTTTWNVLGQLWAEVRAGTGRDGDVAGLSVSTVPYRITVRGAPEGSPQRPEPGQRLRDGARLFRVLAVTEADAGKRYLTLFAREEEVKT